MSLFDRYPVKKIYGKDITIGSFCPEIFISETDEIYCYMGAALKNYMCTDNLFVYPYLLEDKHSTNEIVTERTNGFYRLSNGCIYLGKYIDNQIGNSVYKKLRVRMKFPVSADLYYGILVDEKEDKELTRAVFGLTYSELYSLVYTYAKTIGIEGEYIQYPKITRSIKKTNFCDVTEVIIPPQFPYISFRDSSCLYSHVSLYGFYKHIQLLTMCSFSSVFSKVLVNNGLDENILKKVFLIKDLFWHTKVSRNISIFEKQ